MDFKIKFYTVENKTNQHNVTFALKLKKKKKKMKKKKNKQNETQKNPQELKLPNQ